MKLPFSRDADAPMPSGLRQEIFALGGRHQGDALAGALLELKSQDLTAERRTLLRAVVSHLSPGGRGPAGSAASASVSKPATFTDVFYLSVILAAAAWIAMMIGPRLG